jgi:hypothetical protein
MFSWEQATTGRVRGVYTGMDITLASGADPSSDAFGKGINTEHTVPRSLGSTGMAESDMHHLFPTRVEANSARGNSPFAEIPDTETVQWFRGTASQSAAPTFARDEWSEATPDRFEPREDHEGNAARAVFYHAAVYTTMPTSFFDQQVDDLLRWHVADPVDAYEYARSEWVATQQGTPNPFVLDSTLARRIWGDPHGGGPGGGGPSTGDGDLWINEIHYDDSGADQNEGVEVAGEAETDLAGWSLALYNGSTRSQYGTIALSGVLADQQGGFGTAWVAAPGLQNGSPDGLALVDPDGSVTAFLSWEGTFTASGGPADGLTSDDIGVEEPGTTPEGQSLQLVGTGSAAGDFAWTGPLAGTPGQPNSGQAFEGGGVEPPEPSAWVNEIHYDDAGPDANEGIEIAGTAGLSLAGWTVSGYARNGRLIRTLNLSQTFADEVDGLGAFWIRVRNMPNSTLGIALVNASGEVVQFLSYEGTVTASGGPADGATSVDIGVREGSGTQETESLQLVGAGRTLADFTWVGPAPQSQGRINAGQNGAPSALAATAPEAPVATLDLSGGFEVAPNPVARVARIQLPAPGEAVRVEAFSLLGRRVALLHDGLAPEALLWDTRGLAPGVYVLRVASASGVESTRVTVAR